MMNKYQIALNTIKEALEYVKLSPFLESSAFKKLQNLVDKYDNVCEVLKKQNFNNEKDASIVKDFLEG